MRPAFASCCFLMCSRFVRLPAVAVRASFFGMRKLRAYPSETSRTSPRRPSLATSSSRMTFISVLVRGGVRQQRDRPRALDRVRELALLARAASRDPTWDDLPALRDEAPEPAHILVIDERDLVRTELADFPAAEPPAFYGLLRRRNGYVLLLERNVVVATRRFIGEALRRADRGRRTRA